MKGFLKKIFGFSMGPLVSALLGIILVPVITRYISPDEYGKASMFPVVQGLLSTIVFMGMDQAYARDFSSSKLNRERLLANAMLLPMSLSVIIGICLILCKEWVSYQLFGTENESFAVYLMAIMFPFMVVQNFSLVKLRFEEKGFLYSCFTILLKLWNLCITVMLFLTYQRSFRSVVYGIALAEIFNGSILGIITFQKTHLCYKWIDTGSIKRLLKFALPLVPAVIISWVLTSMDKVMLRSLCTYEELGLYSAAAKIVAALGIIQTCFTTIWIPVAFRWFEEGKDNRYFVLVMKLVAAVMCCACFTILICKNLIGWFLGYDFVQAIAVFPFLMLQPIMYTIAEATSVGISLKRKTGYNILVSSLAGVANLILNYLLIPVLGGVGAAIATGFSYIVFFWVRTLLSRKLWFQFPIGLFVVETFLVVGNCFVHTFLHGAIPYILSVISMGLIMMYILPHSITAIKLLKKGK